MDSIHRTVLKQQLISILTNKVALYGPTFGLDEVTGNNPQTAALYHNLGAHFVLRELEMDRGDTEISVLQELKQRLIDEPFLVDDIVEDFIFKARGRR